MAATKAAALPSMIGTSGPSISMMALSTPRPRSAASRCSAVEQSGPLASPRTVANSVAVTARTSARISRAIEPSPATRWKTMPASSSAGCMVSVTARPECTPMPDMATWSRNVVCLAPFINPFPHAPLGSRGPIPRPNGATLLPLASLPPERGLAPHRYPQRPKSPFDRRNLGQAAGLHQLTLCDRLLPFRLNLLFTEAEKPRPMATMSRQPGNQGFRPFRTNRRYFNNIDGPATFSGAGPYLLAARSVCLPAQESRNIELVLVGRIMHRRGPSVRVQALRSGPPGVFRDRLAVGLTGRGTHRPLDRRHRTCRARGRRRRRLLGAASDADRSQPLHQRHPALLRMVVTELAALRLDLVLCRQRQFVDARHARRAHDAPV